MSAALMHDVVLRYDRRALDAEEIQCQEKIAAEKLGTCVNSPTNKPSYKTDIVQQIEQARQKIQDAITSSGASPPPLEELSPEPETPASSEPATPITPTTPAPPGEFMTKSKRKRERKKRKARAAADAAARTPTTPTAIAKSIVAKAAKVEERATEPHLGRNTQSLLTLTETQKPIATKSANRPTDILQINALVTNNNQSITTSRTKNHMIDYNDPETVKSYINRVDALEQENRTLRNTVSSLHSSLKALEERVKNLELGSGGTKPAVKPASAPAKKEESDDDDIDLFGSDEEDEPFESHLQKPAPKPAAKPAAKKPAKAGPVAKSLIQLYVKPWDDETDMKEMERLVRTIEMDGLVWGTSQLVPVGYGIKKLQIACVVEDEKVSVDDLEEKITSFEDLVQSVDIASFNKL